MSDIPGTSPREWAKRQDLADVRLPVRFQPLLPLQLLKEVPEQPLPFPLGHPRLRLTFSGTAALYQGIRALGLAPGSGVLCPSYNCGHEIEPLLRLGLRPDFYPIHRDLSYDLNELELCRKPDTRAVLITHYFGIGQPLDDLRRFCDRHGLRLIEDCAHALLSDNDEHNLGRRGDIAIFSIRKSVPLPHGGAVLFNDQTLSLPASPHSPPRLGTALKMLELLTKTALQHNANGSALRRWGTLTILAPLHGVAELLRRTWPNKAIACFDPDDECFGFPTAVLDWGMAPFSEKLLKRMPWGDIAERRRDNYLHLSQRLDDLPDCQVPRSQIPSSACPLFLPVAVSNRAELVRQLVRSRIFAAPWWEQTHPSVARQAFPDARYLKDRLMILPIHQDLKQNQLDYMADQIAKSR